LRAKEHGRSVERGVSLIQNCGKALEYVGDAWSDLDCDRHVGRRCPTAEAKGIAEQDFARTDLDQQRW
jgi:hypothetical protein